MTAKTLLMMIGLCLALSMGISPAHAGEATPQLERQQAPLLLAAGDLRMKPQPPRMGPHRTRTKPYSRHELIKKVPKLTGTWKHSSGATWDIYLQRGEGFEFNIKGFAKPGDTASGWGSVKCHKFNCTVGIGVNGNPVFLGEIEHISPNNVASRISLIDVYKGFKEAGTLTRLQTGEPGKKPRTPEVSRRTSKPSARVKGGFEVRVPEIQGTWKNQYGTPWTIEQRGRHYIFTTQKLASSGVLAGKGPFAGGGEISLDPQNPTITVKFGVKQGNKMVAYGTTGKITAITKDKAAKRMIFKHPQFKAVLYR